MTQICNFGITTAITGYISTAVSGLGKPQAVSLQATFTYVASAATSVTAYVQTSIDNAVTWKDIACFQFTTASLTTYLNCNADTAVAAAVTLTEGTLTVNTAINGFLGDQLRIKTTSVGTYGAGTQLRIDAFARG